MTATIEQYLIHPTTRDSWEELIQEAKEKPLDGCGNRALRFALVAERLEQYTKLFIVQVLPEEGKRLFFTPAQNRTYATHYITLLDTIVFDALLGNPMYISDYFTKTFTGQQLRLYYYNPNPETVFKQEHAIRKEEMTVKV